MYHNTTTPQHHNTTTTNKLKISVGFICFSVKIILLSMLTFTLSAQENFSAQNGNYIFNSLDKIRLSEIFTIHKAQFGLGKHDSMIASNNVVDQDGQFATKYKHYYKNIPVEGSMMNIMGQKGIVLSANGLLITGLDIDIDDIISPQSARNIALEYIDADVYPWQDSTLRAEATAEDQNPDSIGYPPLPELIITKKKDPNVSFDVENFKLCYKVRVVAVQPVIKTYVYINAITGEINDQDDGVFEAYTTTGFVKTAHNGNRSNITTTTCSLCSNYRLHDGDRNIFTTHTDVSWNKAGYYNKDNDNVWTESDTRTAASAHWAVQRAWEYYATEHWRAGTDYSKRLIHIQTEDNTGNIVSAGWSGDEGYDEIFIRPDSNGHSAAMLDVLAHELTHGMIDESSGLGKFKDFDARSMSEAFCDIFGMRIEAWATGLMPDWKMAEHMGTYQRNFWDPHQDFGLYTPTGASASTYLESGYWSSTDPYANGGILRKWFQLLTTGGNFNGQKIKGLGINKATDIAYIIFNWWLWPNIQYPDFAYQAIEAVKYEYGECSIEHKQTLKALKAVNLTTSILTCEGVIVEGPTVISVSPDGLLLDESITFFGKKTNDTETDGSYTWVIPKTWDATANGKYLTLNSITSDTSQPLSILYTSETGETYTDTLYVHFSHEEWTPTNSAPATAMAWVPESQILESTSQMSLSPNPVNTTAVLKVPNINSLSDIHVYNPLGALCMATRTSNTETLLDFSAIPEGIYIVMIQGEGINEKVLIQVKH